MAHQYIALLRGINVGGNSVMKMADLKAQFEALGFDDVKTYIQTGNVLFKSSKKNSSNLSTKIETHLQKTMQYQKKVFVLTPEVLVKSAKNNPFEPEKYEKERRCHLMFMSEKPDASNIQNLMAMKGNEYWFHISDKVLYYAYSKEYDGSRRGIDFEKILGVSGTARSWTVVAKLIELTKN